MRARFSMTVALALLLGAGGASASAEPRRQAELELWDDPTFQRQFAASYGFNSEIEPAVREEDRELLNELLPLVTDDAEAAKTKAREILTEQGDNANAAFHFILGNLHFQDQEMEPAAEQYRLAIAKFPSYRRAHRNLGLIEVRLGRFKLAIEPLSKVIELGGEDGLVYGLLGYALSSTEQWVSAESSYRNAMLMQSDTLDWKLGLTQAVLKQQKWGEAVELTGELIRIYPDRSDFWLLQANAWIGLGKPLEAARNFEMVERMGKSTPQSLSTLGDIYVNEQMWGMAGRAYGLAVERFPDQSVQRALRSVEVLAQRGALDEAETLLANIKDGYAGRLTDDERRDLLKIEARVAVADGEGGEEAVGVLEELVAIDPLDGEALLLLGQHYARVDDPERAIFYYERAGGIEAFEADAKVRHAQLLVNQSRYAEAVPLLKQAQELESRDDVARFLEQVERVARAGR